MATGSPDARRAAAGGFGGGMTRRRRRAGWARSEAPGVQAKRLVKFE